MGRPSAPSPAAVVHLQVQGHELGGSSGEGTEEASVEGTPRPSLASRPCPQGQVEGFGLTASPVAQGPPGAGGLPTGPRRGAARGRPGARCALHPGRRLRSRFGSRRLGCTPLGRGWRLWRRPGACPALLLPVVALQVILERPGLGACVVAVRTLVGALSWRAGGAIGPKSQSLPSLTRNSLRVQTSRPGGKPRLSHPSRLIKRRFLTTSSGQSEGCRMSSPGVSRSPLTPLPALQSPPHPGGCPLTCVHSQVHFEVMR